MIWCAITPPIVEVTLVGSPLLAVIAERVMRGVAIDEAEIAREIAPCFVEREGRRTDQIVLACTHFPLIADRIERLSPWPVGFVDPAPAIARRLDALIGAPRSGASTGHEWVAIFTSGDEPPQSLQKTLLRYGLAFTPALYDRLRLRPDRPGNSQDFERAAHAHVGRTTCSPQRLSRPGPLYRSAESTCRSTSMRRAWSRPCRCAPTRWQ